MHPHRPVRYVPSVVRYIHMYEEHATVRSTTVWYYWYCVRHTARAADRPGWEEFGMLACWRVGVLASWRLGVFAAHGRIEQMPCCGHSPCSVVQARSPRAPSCAGLVPGPLLSTPLGRAPNTKYSTMPYSTMPYSTMPYSTVPYRTVPYSSSTIWCSPGHAFSLGLAPCSRRRRHGPRAGRSLSPDPHRPQ